MYIVKAIRKALFKRALNKKINLANKLHALTGYKCFVVFSGKQLMVVRKKDAKELIKKHKIKGSIEQFEKKALYVTT